MTDYDKLTVIKLREELVKRGLPKTGLKAALVQRLVEADALTEQPTPTAEGETKGAHAETQSENNEPNTAAEEVSEPREAQSQLDETISAAVPPQSTADVARDEDRSSQHAAQSPNGIPADALQAKTQEVAPSERDTPAETVITNVQGPQASDAEPYLRQDTEISAGEVPTSKSETPSELPQQEVPLAPASNSESRVTTINIPPGSTQTSVSGGEELKEDTNKRKRRSQSPPPSAAENARKRAKADEGRPHVKLPEDETSKTASQSQQTQTAEDTGMFDAPLSDLPEQAIDEPQNNGDDQVHGNTETSSLMEAQVDGPGVLDSSAIGNSHTAKVEEPPPPKEQQESPPPRAETPPKQSPADARFKNLFTGPSKREGSPIRQKPHSGDEDRVISPALHPATSALYIRDFMRPINPVNLRDHLCTLASPPDTDPNSEIVTEFFLDNVRTHCLVGFANTSAAARVRLGLHDRVWPDERNRKPLWVDFVPEEKIRKWIDVESAAPIDRRQGLKKWEVVYEDEDGDVTAYLQEASPHSSAPRTVQPVPPRKESVAGAHGAPAGPRVSDEVARTSRSGPAVKSDGGKGFQALDELFRATAAKPKLYYLPVAQDTVDRRLHRLAAGRGGGRSDEKRRYTFEEGTLVDKGPEFGFRRGGYGRRGGGGYGGYQGRGGGYRGDNWRGRR